MNTDRTANHNMFQDALGNIVVIDTPWILHSVSCNLEFEKKKIVKSLTMPQFLRIRAHDKDLQIIKNAYTRIQTALIKIVKTLCVDSSCATFERKMYAALANDPIFRFGASYNTKKWHSRRVCCEGKKMQTLLRWSLCVWAFCFTKRGTDVGFLSSLMKFRLNIVSYQLLHGLERLR